MVTVHLSTPTRGLMCCGAREGFFGPTLAEVTCDACVAEVFGVADSLARHKEQTLALHPYCVVHVIPAPDHEPQFLARRTDIVGSEAFLFEEVHPDKRHLVTPGAAFVVREGYRIKAGQKTHFWRVEFP